MKEQLTTNLAEQNGISPEILNDAANQKGKEGGTVPSLEELTRIMANVPGVFKAQSTEMLNAVNTQDLHPSQIDVPKAKAETALNQIQQDLVSKIEKLKKNMEDKLAASKMATSSLGASNREKEAAQIQKEIDGAESELKNSQVVSAEPVVEQPVAETSSVESISQAVPVSVVETVAPGTQPNVNSNLEDYANDMASFGQNSAIPQAEKPNTEEPKTEEVQNAKPEAPVLAEEPIIQEPQAEQQVIEEKPKPKIDLDGQIIEKKSLFKNIGQKFSTFMNNHFDMASMGFDGSPIGGLALEQFDIPFILTGKTTKQLITEKVEKIRDHIADKNLLDAKMEVLARKNDKEKRGELKKEVKELFNNLFTFAKSSFDIFVISKDAEKNKLDGSMNRLKIEKYVASNDANLGKVRELDSKAKIIREIKIDLSPRIIKNQDRKFTRLETPEVVSDEVFTKFTNYPKDRYRVPDSVIIAIAKKRKAVEMLSPRELAIQTYYEGDIANVIKIESQTGAFPAELSKNETASKVEQPAVSAQNENLAPASAVETQEEYYTEPTQASTESNTTAETQDGVNNVTSSYGQAGNFVYNKQPEKTATIIPLNSSLNKAA